MSFPSRHVVLSALYAALTAFSILPCLVLSLLLSSVLSLLLPSVLGERSLGWFGSGRCGLLRLIIMYFISAHVGVEFLVT